MAINDKIFEIGEVSDKVKIDKGAQIHGDDWANFYGLQK